MIRGGGFEGACGVNVSLAQDGEGHGRRRFVDPILPLAGQGGLELVDKGGCTVEAQTARTNSTEEIEF